MADLGLETTFVERTCQHPTGTAPFPASRASRWIARFGLPAAVLLLLVSNIWLSHSFGHSRMMYDNPIYRWRESIAIALSRMQDKPLHG